MDWQYCSPEEGLSRERLLDVHILEATDETARGPSNQRKIDGTKAVRKFIRSGGDNLHSRLPPRSLDSLRKTVAYLTHMWYLRATEVDEDDRAVAVCYHFVMDRLNAVRQELVSEKRKGLEVLRLLLSIVRTYIFVGVRCREITEIKADITIEDKESWYDPHMLDSSTISCVTAALAEGMDCAGDSGEGEGDPFAMIDELTAYSLVSKAFNSFSKSLDVVVSSGSLGPLSPTVFPNLMSPEDTHLGTDAAPMTSVVWQFIGSCLRASNPSRALHLICGLQKVHDPDHPALLALLSRFLPGLALWRLLLIESTANRKEELSLSSIAAKLGLGEGEEPTRAVISMLKCFEQAGTERVTLTAFRCRDGESTEAGRAGVLRELGVHFAGSSHAVTASAPFEQWFPCLM